MASQWPTGDRIRRDPVSKTGPLNATSGIPHTTTAVVRFLLFADRGGLSWGQGRCAPALGPGRIGFNPLGIPTSDPARHSKHATAAGFWVPSMQGIQQAIQTSLKPLRHSPAVKLFTRVPIGIQASDTPESAPRAKQKVSASESLRGQGAVRTIGSLRCRRWCTRGPLRSECVSGNSTRR